MAVGVAVGLSLFPMAELAVLARLIRGIGLFGAALMAIAVTAGAPWLVSWAAVLLVVQYGLSLVTAPGLDPWAPVVGAALFLSVEAAYLSLERRGRLIGPGGYVLVEAGRLTGLTVGVLLMGGLVVAVMVLPATPGILVEVAGVGAVVAALAALILLFHRRA